MRRLLAASLAAASLLTTAGCGASASASAASPLRVCADPNNLPFSNERREGLENALAELLAADLRVPLEYAWSPQRRGFVRRTLDAGLCDVIMGVPRDYELVLTTRPYYRSAYVFVTRRGRYPDLASFDDPRLRRLRVGVQMVGDDGANSPPAHALSARGLTQNVVGFSVLGDYSQPNPPARIVDAVAAGEIDTALVWGPLAGYFAARARTPLEVTPLARSDDGASRPMAFDIALGVRRGDHERRAILDAFIVRRRAAIDGILTRFGVPRAGAIGPRSGA